MIFVFDADILSTFIKVNQLELFPKVCGDSELLITPEVLADLEKSKTLDLRHFIDSKIFKHIRLMPRESDFVKTITKNLGKGEMECIAVCKFRKAYLVTNDKQAINMAESIGISVIDLETMLFSLKEIIDKRTLKQLIEEIESKDKIVIVNQDKILS